VSVEDLFPNVQVPELAGGEPTVEHLRSAMQHHGVLLVRGLIHRERVQLLIDDVDRALAAYDATNRGVRPTELHGGYKAFDRVGVTDK
jgi:hypothetical protein